MRGENDEQYEMLPKPHASPRQSRDEESSAPSSSTLRRRIPQRILYIGQIVLFTVILVQFLIMTYKNYVWAAATGFLDGAVLNRAGSSSSPSKVPDYYQTSPELFPGPTPTGEAAFLAQTNPAPFSSTTYIPSTPLETQVPIIGQVDNGNIFQMHGELSHYFPNPDGFGVEEYSLPKNASIVQLHMLHRHGARYPTSGSDVTTLADKITEYTAQNRGQDAFTGPLAFLNDWTYKLGAEILVPVGKQELFDSGTLHQIMYGNLYLNDGSKIIARSTTQDRMVKSAEYFLAGFFGLDWPSNATLVLAIESGRAIYNNTLAGYNNCNNSRTPAAQTGRNATRQWRNTYLVDAIQRLNSFGPKFNWTVRDAFDAQSLCAYETVGLGYSEFCGLFNFEEWQSYEYSVDLTFAGNNMFQSPTGRAIGIGYVQEILARLQNHLITEPTAQVNVTLDNNKDTFPLDQTLYFDFSHDTNIAAILTAFGLTQFAQLLPTDHIEPNRSMIVSHVTPFAARLDMEIIQTPQPLSGSRAQSDQYESGGATKYIHFILNQRTIPLGASLSACGQRDDGWCELNTFLDIQASSFADAMYDFSCNGEYPAHPYGEVMDGAPLKEDVARER